MTTNGKILLLFLILLLGLILCSFLGGRGCTREGFSSNDVTAVKTDTGIMLTFPDGTTKTLKMTSETSYSANGYTATIASDGTISVSTPSGDTYVTEGFTRDPADSSTNNSSTNNSSTNDSSSDSYYDDSVETDAVNTSYSTSSPPTSTSSSNQGTYNHYDGSYSTTYYGPYGGTATVTNIEDKGKLVTVNNNGSIKLYYIPNSGSTGKSNDSTDTSTATIVTDGNGKAAVKITDSNGNTTVYTINYNQNQSVDNTMNQYDSSSSGSGTDYNNAYVYTGPNGAAATGPNGNTAVAATGPNGNTVVGTNYDSSDYYSSLPPGISANQIPAGQEDLYILKSQVVPPVCPKCPDPILRSNDSTDVTKCPPCPPCARCPEPAFDCKKVPNYNAFNPDYMPVPVLSDFSGFGM